MLRTRFQRIAGLCFVSGVLAVPSHAAPQAWTLVRSEPGIQYHLNKAAVQRQGTHIRYWILVTFSYDPKFDGAEPYKSARLLRHANCATREQDTKSLLQYHAPMGRGPAIWAQTFDDATLRMEPVEPGSVGAQLLDIACAFKK